MKKSALLNHRLSAVIAEMGHTDKLVVADAGLPIPAGIERIDLAVSPMVPRLLEVLAAVATELQVEKLTIAGELVAGNASLVESIRATFPAAIVEITSHAALKELSATARAVARTGEFTPYANVVLWSGVTF